MKYLKVLVLLIVLTFSTSVSAQEKEAEKPKEKPKEERVEKPKESPKNDLSNVRPSNEPHRVTNFWTSGPRTRNKTQESIRTPADVIGVELVFEEVPQNKSNEELCFPEKPPGIEVMTQAINPSGDPLTYNYTVSGGKIIGSGKRVVWDLSKVRPGTYYITAAVDEGCGFCGKVITKSVIVKE